MAGKSQQRIAIKKLSKELVRALADETLKAVKEGDKWIILPMSDAEIKAELLRRARAGEPRPI